MNLIGASILHNFASETIKGVVVKQTIEAIAPRIATSCAILANVLSENLARNLTNAS